MSLPAALPQWDRATIRTFGSGPYTKSNQLDAYLSPFRRQPYPTQIKGNGYYSVAQLVGTMRSGAYLPIEAQTEWLIRSPSANWTNHWREAAPHAFDFAALVYNNTVLQEHLLAAPGKTLLYTNGRIAGAIHNSEDVALTGYNLLGLAWTKLRGVNPSHISFDWRRFRFRHHPPWAVVPPTVEYLLP